MLPQLRHDSGVVSALRRAGLCPERTAGAPKRHSCPGDLLLALTMSVPSFTAV